MSRSLIFIAGLLAAAIAPFAAAQDTATISGTVTDPSGSAVPHAQVTLLNTGTQFTRTVATNTSGQYIAASIPTGSYTVTVTAPGFQRLERSGVQLTAASTVGVDLSLTIGSETQSVSVTADAAVVQSESATVSNLVTTQQIADLPLVSRDFTDLVLLAPGAHSGSANNLAEGGSPYAMRSGANFSVNGSVPQANSYLIDGIYNRNLWLNTLIMVPVVDAIQEYRVMTSAYTAEYGESAGSVTEVETRSGTNQLHGDVWEFLRNDKLNANQFFNNSNNIARPPFRRNEFGGTAGGAIVKNKSFFFGDYQGIRISQPQTYISTIPTLAQRQMVTTGDFSGFNTPIYNPYSTTTLADGSVARNPFPGNQIPQNMLDPAAIKLMQLEPAPTTAGNSNNFVYNPALTQRTDQFDVRLDQNIGSSDRIFFRYGYDNSSQIVPGVVPAPASANIGPYLSTNSNGINTPLVNQSATLGYTKVIGPATVLEAHAGVVRWNAHITPLGNPFPAATQIGIPGININDKSGGLPAFTISGFTEIGDNSTYPENSQITTFQYDGALSITRGSHTIKFGLLFLRDRFNGYSAFPTRGAFDFNGQFTRQIGGTSSSTALADFALGAPDNVNRNVLTSTFGMRLFTLAPYVQDMWRVNDRLTLQLGLRWEVDAPPYDIHNHWANVNVNTGLLELAGQNGNGRRLRNTDYNTLSPRIGVAYSLGADRKTVLRSGFGISYVNMDAGGAQLYKNPPYFFNQTITTNIAGAPVTTISAGLPTPVPPGITDIAALSTGSLNAWDWNLRQSEIIQWNFGIQREFLKDYLLDVTYVGTRGERLLVNSLNLNQSVPGPGAQNPRRPYYTRNPNLVNLSYRTGAGDSKYESLQMKLDKRFSEGLVLGVSYTYGSYLSDAGLPNGGGNGDIQNHFCVACNWGPMPEDFMHVFTLNHVYRLPFGHGRKYLTSGPAAWILGNWDINGIWSAHTGGHFTPVLGTSVSNSAGGGTQRPNRIANGNLPSGQRPLNHWFDTAAFVAPPLYSFGNSGTGIIEGPGFFDVDLGLVRSIPITERISLNLRGEAFNAFNRANFNNPNASIGTGPVGIISSTQPARIVQLAAKLVF